MTASRNTFEGSYGKDLAKYTMAITVMMTGVPSYKIRRLEDFGLCKPARTGSQQRLFMDRDIELIRQIALLEKDGVNLPGIKVILEMQNSTKLKDEGVNQ